MPHHGYGRLPPRTRPPLSRCIIARVIAQAPTEITVTFPKLHDGQLRVIRNLTRNTTLAEGRRWGKTTLLEYLCCRDLLNGQPVGWFTPSYKYVDESWDRIKSRLGVYPAGAIEWKSEQQHRLRVVGGGTLDLWSLETDDPGRGRKYALALIDEAALVANLWNVFFSSIRPTLADLRGSTVFAGTPKRRNDFWRFTQMHHNNNEWTHFTAPTHENPYIPPEELKQLKQDMPDRLYRQEILAEFLEDGDSVFRNIDACATSIANPQAEPNHYYTFGIDWGRQRDATIVSVFDATLNEQVWIDVYRGTEYLAQMNHIRGLYNRYRPVVIHAEENAMGAPVVEMLTQLGLPMRPFQTSTQSKALLIDYLVLAFEQMSIKILPSEQQLDELKSYESTTLPSGLTRYAAPGSAHDDHVIALALSVYAARAAQTPSHTARPYRVPYGAMNIQRRSQGLLADETGVNPFAKKGRTAENGTL